MDQQTIVLLPDGRLCSFSGYERIPTPIPQTNSHQTAESEPAWRAIKSPQVKFIGGSNWVAIASTGRELAGVKSDGSLWSAPWFEQVDQAGNVFPLRTGSPPQKGLKVRATGLKFERFGNESGWAMVAASWQHCVALKRDGTIWGWGYNGNKQLGDGPVSSTNGPVQIGQDSNWVAVYAGQEHSYSVNRAGEIWKWGRFTTEMQKRNTVTELSIGNGPVKLNFKVPGVRSITAGRNDFDLILDTDGNLWGVGQIPPALGGGGFGNQYYSEPKRIGGTNWHSVSCHWQALAGLKTDGTLWNQRSHDPYNSPPAPEQLGKRNDWIAVMSDWEADVALAKDGTICRFGEPPLSPGLGLLAPTRRVTWRLNLLDAAK
jgi:alpha-tubulin suppressor-like RCC1 family protein